MQALTSSMKPLDPHAYGVLVLRDELEDAAHVDRLRLETVPTWTASTGFELLWLFEHMSARPSVALVDLRPLTHDRAARVADLASLVAASRLPVILIGGEPQDEPHFPRIAARLPADAPTDDIVASVHANL